VIVAHLSDLHLGYRAYDRTERGQNVRERDVAAAFDHAVRALLRIQPGLIVVSGDVFDRPDPPPGALIALTRGLDTLRGALGDTPVLMVAGARDTPRRPGDPGALAALDMFPQVQAATGTVRSRTFRELSVHVCMIPYGASLEQPFPVPETDPRARWNVLVAHARATDATAGRPGVDAAEWDYVALGSEHRHRKVRPGVYYAGSLERVGQAPWDEAAVDKGFVTFDLESRVATFIPIPGRPVVALAPIRVPSGDPERLTARIEEVTGEVPGGVDGKIVQLILQGVSARELLSIQGGALASLRQRALHLAVQVEDRPGRAAPAADLRTRVLAALEASGGGTEARRQLLDDVLALEPARVEPAGVGSVS
jgi:DNA repair exonuclease SbcCD nuclease subunit